ncbi:TonB-dependent receptor [Herbaspirillum sp. alder98]|uniref:TonB-dependent receptor n=1 Tax=Herbaspirillum sp. alder98 TaxID=2913096 RepID=UPI001CD8C542|nr:TonB-dependent receptor [Herbaspirillum sp. alder98]MCA1325102.1 TonB-dependent receptor [Herbaspirillum sp. alder98]
MILRLTPLATALALAFLAPTSSLAQTTTSTTTADEQALPTVTVNASADASAGGLPEAYAGGQVARGGRVGMLGNIDFLDSPIKVTSYTQELIKDQQARGVGDVLKNDPAVRTTRGFGNFQESYMIRGFIATSDDLMYNGLYGVLPRQYVAAEMMERVEVMLGASAFLNGAAPGDGGLGGTINIVPKRASADPVTQFTAGYETGNQKYGAVDIGRRFGPDDRVGLRLNAVRRAGGTAVNNENRETNLLTLGADYRGNDFRLSGDIGLQENNLTSARPNLTVGTTLTALPAAPDASTNYNQRWGYSNARDLFGTLRGEWDLSANTTAWAAAGTRMSTENNSLFSPTVNSLNGAATGRRFDNAREDTVRTGEIGIRTRLDTGAIKHSVNLAASTYWLDSRNAFGTSTTGGIADNIYNPFFTTQPAITSTTGGNLANPQTTTKTQLWSAALSDTMSFYDERIALTLGARHQSLKSNSYSYINQSSTARYKESALSPMAGLVVKPLKNLSVYANYIEGLQQGKQITDTAAANFGQILAPYKSKQKEIGVKFDTGSVGLGLAFFTTTRPLSYKDTITNIESTNGLQRNRGVELNAFGSPLKSLRLLAGVTFLQAKQEQTSAGLNNGKYAIGVPKMQANVGAEWDVPGMQGLAINGRATYTSTQYVDAANRLELPSWVRYDLGARYITRIANHAVTFRGSVENLANRSYWESAGGASNSGYLVLNTPRTFVTSVSVDF